VPLQYAIVVSFHYCVGDVQRLSKSHDMITYTLDVHVKFTN